MLRKFSVLRCSETAPTLEAPPTAQSRLARWRHALSTVNPPEGRLDAVSNGW